MNSISPRSQLKRTPEPQPESESEPMNIPDEAQREKELGNAAYKKKDFETAIQHYTKAMDLDDKDIFYITNRAACHTKLGALPEGLKYMNKCIEQINKTNRRDISLEEMKGRQAKAMQDPDIQHILSDPVMTQILMDFQENPKATKGAL